MPSGQPPPDEDPPRRDRDPPPDDSGARDASPADPAAGRPAGDAPPPESLSPPPGPAGPGDPEEFPAAGTPPPEPEPPDTEPPPASGPPGSAGSYRADEPPPQRTPPPGTPPPGAPPPEGPVGGEPGAHGLPPAPTGPDSRNWAMAAHLSSLAMFLGIPWFVGPLVVWLLKRDDPFVDAHGKEALNFNLSLLIYGVVLLVAGVVGGIVTLGLLVIPVAMIAFGLGIAWLVLVIVASVRASNGESYQYPMTLRLVQ